MQEIIKLVTSIRNDINDLRSMISRLSITHAQRLSEEWMTSDQVMFILKISLSTLKKLKETGKLPYSKIKGLQYFRTIDIENLLNQSTINHSSKNNLSTIKIDPNE